MSEIYACPECGKSDDFRIDLNQTLDVKLIKGEGYIAGEDYSFEDMSTECIVCENCGHVVNFDDVLGSNRE